MPIVKNFRSTNVWKAFILNSITATFVIFVAITIKSKMDNYTAKKDDEVKRETSVQSISLTLLSTFAASMIAYTAMYFIFGFGKGMLA